MAVYWQPPDDDPVAQFTPEPGASTTAAAAASVAAVTNPRVMTMVDAVLLTVAGAAVGAILFSLYWTLR